jgi:hypothetical protein
MRRLGLVKHADETVRRTWLMGQAIRSIITLSVQLEGKVELPLVEP